MNELRRNFYRLRGGRASSGPVNGGEVKQRAPERSGGGGGGGGGGGRTQHALLDECLSVQTNPLPSSRGAGRRPWTWQRHKGKMLNAFEVAFFYPANKFC